MYHTLPAKMNESVPNIAIIERRYLFANHHVLSIHVKFFGGVPFGKLTWYWTIHQ